MGVLLRACRTSLVGSSIGHGHRQVGVAIYQLRGFKVQLDCAFFDLSDRETVLKRNIRNTSVGHDEFEIAGICRKGRSKQHLAHSLVMVPLATVSLHVADVHCMSTFSLLYFLQDVAHGGPDPEKPRTGR